MCDGGEDMRGDGVDERMWRRCVMCVVCVWCEGGVGMGGSYPHLQHVIFGTLIFPTDMLGERVDKSATVDGCDDEPPAVLQMLRDLR